MEVLETRRYLIVKFIVIGVLMLIDLFILSLLIAATQPYKDTSTLVELGLVIYVFVTIPLFLAIAFPKVEFKNNQMILKYIGIIKIHKPIQNLLFSYTSEADGINITNISGQRFITIYQNNTTNYNDVVAYLGSRIMNLNNSSTRKRPIYILWLGIGLLLWFINWLI